jgi:xanthine dehydrogenase molybdopterin-binding subunit B
MFHITIYTDLTVVFNVTTRIYINSRLLFSRTPGIGYDMSKNEGKPFNYFTYGVACSEVEIDCLTGDHQVILQLTTKYIMICLFKFY